MKKAKFVPHPLLAHTAYCTLAQNHNCPALPLEHDYKVSAMGEFYTYVSAHNEQEAIQKAKGRNFLRAGTPLVSFSAENLAGTGKVIYGK